MKMTMIKKALKRFGIAACRFQTLNEEQWSLVRDRDRYDVYQSGLTYHPWERDSSFRRHYDALKTYTLVPVVQCWIIYSLARQALCRDGEVWECGVYRGGTALLLRGLRDELNSKAHLRLFDTFAGMPETDPAKDIHRSGHFCETSLAYVKAVVGEEGTSYHQGCIPRTFEGLEQSSIAFAHVDLDLYDGILESCRFIYPRLVKGGVIVFDDYGYPSCPGARAAVDEFFSGRTEVPLILPTGQALVFKMS
jgi:O-methyltransferase